MQTSQAKSWRLLTWHVPKRWAKPQSRRKMPDCAAHAHTGRSEAALDPLGPGPELARICRQPPPAPPPPALRQRRGAAGPGLVAAPPPRRSPPPPGACLPRISTIAAARGPLARTQARDSSGALVVNGRRAAALRCRHRQNAEELELPRASCRSISIAMK